MQQKDCPQDPRIYRDISIGSIMVKVLTNIVLTRLTAFYNSELLTTKCAFVLVKNVMMADIASNNSRKSHTPLIENCIE